MINCEDYTNGNKTEHNLKWPYNPNHSFRILIIGGSGSRINKCILNLMNNQLSQILIKCICMQKI